MAGGVNLVFLLGIVNIFLLVFQLATGLRWIKVPFGVHRKTGILLFGTAVIHGVLGVLANM